MKIAAFMDPIENLKSYKDTTLAILHEASIMGMEIACFTPAALYSLNGTPYASCNFLQINASNDDLIVNVTHEKECNLAYFDIILIRKDPPFNLEYIYATYALELAEKAGVVVANRPQAIRDVNEKFFTQWFTDSIPETLITKRKNKLFEFYQEHKEVVLKPLDTMGGQSIFRVNNKDYNINVIIETLTNNETVSIIAQKYIPEISKTGDKRILLVNGKPIPFALARFPQKGDFRGNLAAGGIGKVVPLTKKDYELCQKIAPILKNKGLSFVGLDVIGEYITEINVTSPTCLREIQAAIPKDKNYINIAESYLQFLQELVLSLK